MAPSKWPGLSEDDKNSLSALASNNRGDRMSFDEAFALISPEANRESAQALWDYVVDYYGEEEPAAEPVEP